MCAVWGMERQTHHLSIVGTPSSFDYSPRNNLVAVTTLRSIALFNVNSALPTAELFFDHPGYLSQVQFQASNNGLFSTIVGDCVTLFDAANGIRSINEVIGTPGRITCSDWSPLVAEHFATCCDSGYLSMWDMRAISKASLQIATGKYCDKVKWSPTCPHILSLSCENRYLMLWDVRMVEMGKPRCLQVIEPLCGVVNYCWDYDRPNILVGSRSTIESWSLKSATCEETCELRQSQSCDSLTFSSELLSFPSGSGLLLSNTVNRQLSVVDLSPESAPDTDVAVSELCKAIKSSGFETTSGIVGMQWHSAANSAADSPSLMIMTDAALLHKLSPPRESATSGSKVFMLRTSRHVVGGREDPEVGQISPTLLASAVAGKKRNSSGAGGALASLATLARSSVTKDVVGPLAFSTLLESEIGALDSSIRTGQMDGVRIERFDQFGRRIVLELLIPAMDPFSLRNRTHDGSYSAFYRPDELHQFTKKSSAFGHTSHRTVSLLVSFSSKVATFWTPTFLLDNKCGVDLGGDLFITKLLGDLSSICKNLVAAESKEATTRDESSEPMLVQVARSFRKSILKQWEKGGSDRLSVSFGSHRPNSGDNMASKSLMNAASVGPSFDAGHSAYMGNIDELSFKVPYPVSSGGIFNSRGELVCFGAAKLKSSSCLTIASVSPSVFREDNRSYATYQMSMIRRSSASAAAMAASPSTEDSSSKPNTSNEKFDLSVSVDTATYHQLAEGEDTDKNQDEDGEYDYQFSFDRESKSFPKAHSAGTEAPEAVPSVKQDIRRNISIASYFVSDLDFKSEAQPSSTHSKLGTPIFRPGTELVVYPTILSTSRDLAAKYSLGPLVHGADAADVGSDVSVTKIVLSEFSKRAETCRFNAKIALEVAPKSRSIIQFWSLLAVALDVFTVVDTGGLIGWNNSVLGCSLLFRLIQYLWKINDLQTFAVAICVAGGTNAVKELISVFRKGVQLQQQQAAPAISFELVDFGKLTWDIDNILHSYSEILRMWGTQSMATAVQKHMARDYSVFGSHCLESEFFTHLSVGVHCLSCEKVVEKSAPFVSRSSSLLSVFCQDCNDWAQYCAICQSSIRGYLAVCSLCGHGGHTDHMRHWFETCNECPTGCGCKCNSLVDEDESVDPAEESDSEEEDIYYRGDVIDVYGGTSGKSLDKSGSGTGYDTYDFNRPHYLESFLGESNYREYNYNNFYETMKDYPGSIEEEGSGSEDDQ